MALNKIKSELKAKADPEKAILLSRYFKTGPGEYGEGDKFIGVVVPKQRQVVKKYALSTDLKDLLKLLKSKTHEYRLTALLALVLKYEKGDDKIKKKIYKAYLANTNYINNWDLVDLSAPKIIGAYLLERRAERKILYKLARSKNLWERRIAVLATFTFIKNDQFKDSLKIAKILLSDEHDLIHKAVGWMLREIGKIDPRAEEQFLEIHCLRMPRTMLRYAIEKFPEKKRQFYLKK